MANQLNEMDPVILEEGLDVNVIAKQLPVEEDSSTKLVILGSYVAGVAIIAFGIIAKKYILALVGVGIIYYVFSTLKKTDSYFQQLQQRLQHSASQIDNYLEQRVRILENTARLVEKAIQLDQDTFKGIAELRSMGSSKTSRNEVAEQIETVSHNINVAVESYPELKSHMEIRDAMQQNVYLQREITAAREIYNDNVAIWNREIFEWPFKKHVAAKNHYTTRIPFIASKEVKERSRDVFF